ncbi:hypothetical protein [Acuticoccus sediminis]|uniref:hypothetical protein n=1 Tax=Acuticoccus sediminis TaxID=2184697 RepID=UPI0011B93D3D|nr:hypothetical protein [Acuticoccus sediminis]
MVLSNAERQKRYRERLKERAGALPGPPAEFVAIDDPMVGGEREKFLGFSRIEWSCSAPEEIVDLCGMRNPVERWRANLFAKLGKDATQLFNSSRHDTHEIAKRAARLNEKASPYR